MILGFAFRSTVAPPFVISRSVIEGDSIVPTYLQSVESALRRLFIRVWMSAVGGSLPAGAQSGGIVKWWDVNSFSKGNLHLQRVNTFDCTPSATSNIFRLQTVHMPRYNARRIRRLQIRLRTPGRCLLQPLRYDEERITLNSQRDPYRHHRGLLCTYSKCVGMQKWCGLVSNPFVALMR